MVYRIYNLTVANEVSGFVVLSSAFRGTLQAGDDDQDILDAMIVHGLLKEWITLEDVEIIPTRNAQANEVLEVTNKETGMPVFHLVAEE